MNVKQNTSNFEVHSSSQAFMVPPPHPWIEDPSMQSRRRGPSISSHPKLLANKYSISNACHTIINDNHTYNVYKYTIHDDFTTIHTPENTKNINQDTGFYGSYTYDNDNYSSFVNGKYTFNNSVYGEGTCNNSDDIKDADEEEDSFTFSSVADSMEFFNFNSSACSCEAEACMLMQMSSMSPADELFQDGKIRPLMQPIANRHEQPNHSNALLDQHSSFNDFAAQYLANANHSLLKREFHAETLDNSQDLLREEELDPGLSSDINQKLKELCTDQRECKPNYAELPLQISSSSAPTSPVKENLANVGQTDNNGSHQYYSVVSTSQVSCYKRCRSLSRVFQIEDNEQILEVQDLVEDGTKGGLLNYKRKTLQDLLTQEEKFSPMSKPEMIKGPCKMVDEKQLSLASPNRSAKNFYDAERSPSLALEQINTPHLWPLREIPNTPHLWPIREKISRPPTTNGKSSMKGGVISPHELHYGSQKAQAERMKKKTFLPYRPGLLGCLRYPPQ